MTPISLPFAGLIFALWTWPFWLTLNGFGMFIMGRAFHVVYAVIGSAIAAALLLARRAVFERGSIPTVAASRAAKRRAALVAAASLLFILAHALALPQRLVFLYFINDFERARIAAMNSLAADTRAPHRPIAVYDIHAVKRLTTGEIGFHAGNEAIGSSFVWVPPGNATADPVFYPPDESGHLWGNWYWWATD